MAFATAADVAARRGEAAYTGTELAQVNALLDSAEDLILDAVDKTDAWATDPATILPDAFKRVSIELAHRALSNPAGARSTSETLGAHSYSQSFKDGVGTLELTDSEVHRLRRAVWGRNSGSARSASLVDDLICGDIPGS